MYGIALTVTNNDASVALHESRFIEFGFLEVLQPSVVGAEAVLSRIRTAEPRWDHPPEMLEYMYVGHSTNLSKYICQRSNQEIDKQL